MDPQEQARSHNLRRWLKLTALALICSIGALVGALYLFTGQTRTTREVLARQHELAARQRLLREVLGNFTTADTNLRSWLLTGTQLYLERYDRAVAAIPTGLDQVDAAAAGDPLVTLPLRTIHQLAQDWMRERAKVRELELAGARTEAIALLQDVNGERDLEETSDAINAILLLGRSQHEELMRRLLAVSEVNERLAWCAAGALILTVALGLFQIVALWRSSGRYQRAIEDSERFLRELTDKIPVRLGYIDQDLRVQFANRPIFRDHGLPQELLLGRAITEVSATARDPAHMAMLRQALAGNPQRVEHADSQNPQRQVESRLIPDYGDDGKVRGVFAIGVDITEQKANERRLAQQSATLEAVIEAMPASVAVWDTAMRYLMVNREWERWRGFSREEVAGRTIEDVMGTTEFQRNAPWMRRALAGEDVAFEWAYPGAGAGDPMIMSVTYLPLRLADGAVGGFIGIAQDITAQREEKTRLLYLSERDPLTGLMNRAGFEAWLKANTGDGQGRSLAALYIDLDHFKPVNDSYGHGVGDQVLKLFAQRLLKLAGPGDAVARLGGDEFGIVLTDVAAAERAFGIADRVVQAAREPFHIGDLHVGIGASVGVAFDADNAGDWEGLVSRADDMVYKAKARGRGRRVAQEVG